MKSLQTKWPTARIGDLCDVSRGSSPRPIHDQRYFEGGTIPWTKIADATKTGKFLYATKQQVNEYGASFSRLLPPGTILVAASGTLGYTQILGVEGCAHDGWLILTNLRGIDRDFAYYTLQWMEQHFYNAAYGAAIQNINTEILRETEIPYPPLPTQGNISAILSAYDDLIENNNRRIKLFEDIAQLIYHEWFVNHHFPSYEKVRIIDSPFGSIPEGWDIDYLSNFADFIKGIEPGSENYHAEQNEGMVPFLRVGDLGSRQSEIFIAKELCRDRLLQPNDIAITMDGTVGLVRIGLFGAYSSGIRKIVITNSERLGWGFTYFLLKSDYIQGIIHAHAKGTTIKHASSSIEHLLFLLPPIDVMENFENHTSTTLKAILNLSDKNKLLRRSRDLLLPKLISGEVDVSELDIDIGEAET